MKAISVITRTLINQITFYNTKGWKGERKENFAPSPRRIATGGNNTREEITFRSRIIEALYVRRGRVATPPPPHHPFAYISIGGVTPRLRTGESETLKNILIGRTSYFPPIKNRVVGLGR